MALTRRRFAALAAQFAALALARPAIGAAPPMARVIIDNDLAGDPDGLFALAHHVLSPSVEIPLIVGSHLPDMPGFPNSGRSAAAAVERAEALLKVMGKTGAYPLKAGAERAIPSRAAAKPSAATSAIVAEALRSDAPGTLVYAAGAGLTELALAWLANPAIGKRLRLVWIGGLEHPGLAYPPPNADAMEYNYSIDPLAAQIVFNESDIEIWQVPRDAYRQMLVSRAELAELAAGGPIGRFLVDTLDEVDRMIRQLMPNAPFPRSETYILGDSPLVTFTALQSFFQPDSSSSEYKLLPTPHLLPNGAYRANSKGRPMRVYTRVDTRLTFADMTAKLRAADRALAAR